VQHVRKPGGPTPVGGPEAPRPREIPINWFDAWLQQLPKASIVQLFGVQEARYDHTLTQNQTFSVGTMTVARQQVWIFTDIEYYAMTPAAGMSAPPAQLPQEALHGILRIDLTFGGKTPYHVDSSRLLGYATPGQQPTTRSGWPWLQKVFGAQRMPSFAVYARSEEEVRLEGVVEDVPRFPIVKVGVNLHGFTLPEALFDDIWKGMIGNNP